MVQCLTNCPYLAKFIIVSWNGLVGVRHTFIVMIICLPNSQQTYLVRYVQCVDPVVFGGSGKSYPSEKFLPVTKGKRWKAHLVHLLEGDSNSLEVLRKLCKLLPHLCQEATAKRQYQEGLQHVANVHHFSE